MCCTPKLFVPNCFVIWFHDVILNQHNEESFKYCMAFLRFYLKVGRGEMKGNWGMKETGNDALKH